MSNAREEILAAVREAVRDAPAVEIQEAQPTLPPTDRAAMLDRFAELVADYRATVVRCRSQEVQVRVLTALRGSRRAVLPEGVPQAVVDAVAERLGADNISDGDLDDHELEGYDCVVTTSAVGISATGTVVLDHSSGQGRRALTLLPDLHVVIVRATHVVPDVPDAVRRLDPLRPQTWISGPSATSDIELSRVEGVHGPRTLVVLLVED